MKSLQQHLISCGWSGSELSRNGRDARLVGIARGAPHYEPFSRLRRLFSPKSLPLSEVIRCGMKFRFLGSLRHEVQGISGGSVSFLVRIHDAVTGSNYASEPVFWGYIEWVGNPPVQEFPFDTWLVLEEFHPVACRFKGENGASWKITNIALTHVCDIEVQDAT